MSKVEPIPMSKLRVVVVDDSDLCRSAIQYALEAEGDIAVVGEAGDGQKALDVVAQARPDLVTLDVDMPRMDGLAAVEQIMARFPVPILIVTGRPPELRTSTHFEAVRRGALDVIAKPPIGVDAEASALRVLVRRLARVPVMRHLAGRRTEQRAPAAPTSSEARNARERSGTNPAVRVVGIGASAGGPAAVAAVLSRLPRDFPACICLVQHLLPDFAQSYVQFLRAETMLDVALVRGPSPLRPGVVLVAADDHHLVVRPDASVAVSAAAPVKGYRPSADVLFDSLARHYGASAAGVVLSGIGDDGAAGLLAMRRAGALTFAQDEETSMVFGMPRAARDVGAAMHVLPLDAIADELLRAVRAGHGRTSRKGST